MILKTGRLKEEYELLFRYLNYSSPCERCRANQVVIFNYSILHVGNLTEAGAVCAFNVQIKDILPSSFTLSCEKCDRQNLIKNFIPGTKQGTNCHDCYTKIVLQLDSISRMATAKGAKGDFKLSEVVTSRLG